MSEKTFVIDFDSTFTEVEALDVLCEIVARNSPGGDAILDEVQEITNKGMAGEISFEEGLRQRIELLQANREHIPELVEHLKDRISSSVERNKAFFETHADRIFIISSGFKEFIVPVVEEFGIPSNRVFANTFQFDENGDIVGFDEDNPLAKNSGKVELLQQLDLEGEVYVVGDGYNDYLIREAGLADKFYGFTENVAREIILDRADHITPSLDEFLYEHNLNTALSYPKNRIKVLLLEGVHPDAEKQFREEGYTVETSSQSMTEDELCEAIQDVSILGIRSGTQVTERVLEHADRLLLVGAFCIGTNQIDLEACLQKGVVVFNAPFSNTRSVVELTIAHLIELMRRIPDKMTAMQNGRWRKSSEGSREVRGKKLGIIGYGNIGAQVSVVAESLGMDVYFYDLTDKLALGNATRCHSMEEVLSISDVVTVHVDGRPENNDLIDAGALDQMKDGAVLLNLSRGFVVDVKALRERLDTGKIGGAALDVFPTEPDSKEAPFESVLQGAPNVILTPHIGGNTEEAQQNIGSYVPNKVFEYINNGSTTNSVNFPNVQLPKLKQVAHRFMHIHHNEPGVLAKIGDTLARHNINVVGQYLKTNETIGYVITDIDKKYNEEVRNELKEIENTIRFRVLY